MPEPRPASLVARGATTEIESTPSRRLRAVRLPCLTILYHPDLSRIGERALLAGFDHGQAKAVSRVEPRFAHPGPPPAAGSPGPRALEDLRLSRKPLWIEPQADGGIGFDPSSTRTPLEVDGEPVSGTTRLDRTALETGVLLLLGGHVLLLLHRVDPQQKAPATHFGLVGESDRMLRLQRDIERLSNLDVPVLLLGETGTGKELVARALHEASHRRAGPYVAVNMAAIPTQLAAAELFGAVKGAFTGADRRRRGHFLSAQGGTLFLDEVGDMPPDVQVMLLRALESNEIQPVGADTALPVRVRLVAATDADLDAAVDEQRFRAPLLHRLAGFVIRLPTLAERPDDFGRLFAHFLQQEAANLGQSHRLQPAKQPWVPAALVARWALRPWPGNVRQLRNAVRQLVIAHQGDDQVELDVEPESHRSARVSREVPETGPVEAVEVPDTPYEVPGTTTSEPPYEGSGTPYEVPGTPSERRARRRRAKISEADLLTALRRNRFELQATADDLAISRPSLYDRIKKHPDLRTAADLERKEIASAAESCDGDVHRMATQLKVSERALRRRMGQLGIRP
ncbi:MAG: sigma 54-interacting transcriptional regulator [Acidobacteriota bacterium]